MGLHNHSSVWYNGGMTAENWKDIGVAVITAAPGIAALIWNILRARTKVKIRLLHRYHVGGNYQHTAAVKIINEGGQKVKLVQIGFRGSDKRTAGLLFPDEFGLPVWVQPKDHAILAFTQEHIENFRKNRKAKEKLKYVFVADATGNSYRARLSKDIKKLLFG